MKMNEMENEMKVNGLDATKFYSMNLKLPLGAKVEVMVDGKKLDLASVYEKTKAYRLETNDDGSTNIISNLTGEIYGVYGSGNRGVAEATMRGLNFGVAEEYMALRRKISDDGFVKNAHLWRRWITAQTFRMLNWQYGGWDGYLNMFAYSYQFEMIINEYNAIAAMQRDGDVKEVAHRSYFFNHEVGERLMSDYIRRLKKYVAEHTQSSRKYGNYVKLTSKYGYLKLDRSKITGRSMFEDVLLNPLLSIRQEFRMLTESNFKGMRDVMIKFYKLYNKLPYGTTKCAVWKDAYRGSGAFYSLQNLVMFHGVTLYTEDNVALANPKEALDYLDKCMFKKAWAGWQFQMMLRNVITKNNFNLKKSIEAHKVA